MHLTEKDKHWLRVKGWKIVFQENGPHKHIGVAIIISDIVEFRLKSVRRDDEVHFILNKRMIKQKFISY
jgi:hypothetical protein